MWAKAKFKAKMKHAPVYNILLQLFLFLILSHLIADCSYAQDDLNGNKVPDFFLTQIEPDSRIRWIAQDLKNLETEDLGIFGQAGYQLNMSAWRTINLPSRSYVLRDQFNQFMLFVEGISDPVAIGQSKGVGSVFLGRDLDSSGLSDAVVIYSNRERLWAWIISFDPLGRAASSKRILFGSKNDIPFLFRNRGKNDSLAVLRIRGPRTEIVYRGLTGKLIRTIRLAGFPVSRNRPLTLKSNAQGIDSLVFLRTGPEGPSLTTINHRGKIESSIKIPSGYYPVIHGFNSETAEEIIFASATEVILPDQRRVPIMIERALPLDGSSVRDYLGEEVSATPVPSSGPTASATFTSTALPPPGAPTSPPVPTTPFTHTPTAIPTITFTPTPTITPTADTIAPSGFSLTFNQGQINNANQNSISFTISNGEIGTTYSYSIDDTDAGTPIIAGSGTITSTSQTISGVNVNSLRDGLLFLVVTLRDASNNITVPQVSSRQKDATNPITTTVSVVNGSYGVGSYMPIIFQMSESVVVSGIPKISLDVGGTSREAIYDAASSNASFLAFRYQVQANDNDANGITITSSSINLNGGTISDSFGNPLTPGFTQPDTATVVTYGTAANCNALRTVGFYF